MERTKTLRRQQFLEIFYSFSFSWSKAKALCRSFKKAHVAGRTFQCFSKIEHYQISTLQEMVLLCNICINLSQDKCIFSKYKQLPMKWDLNSEKASHLAPVPGLGEFKSKLQPNPTKFRLNYFFKCPLISHYLLYWRH